MTVKNLKYILARYKGVTMDNRAIATLAKELQYSVLDWLQDYEAEISQDSRFVFVNRHGEIKGNTVGEHDDPGEGWQDFQTLDAALRWLQQKETKDP